MNITILAVGRLKEKYWQDALGEYLKRLSAYAKVNVIEVVDENTPEEASLAIRERIKNREGQQLLKHIKPGTFLVALDRRGKDMSSRGFAGYLAELSLQGNSHITLIIGGSLGLADSILKLAHLQLSFSRMTFPHQLMRVVLLEQIYRAFKINRGEPYHK